MKVIAAASLLACAFSLDAQITATLNHIPNRMPEIRIRNNSAIGLTAFAIRMNPVVRSAENSVAFVDFFDTAIDTRATPLPPREERTVPVTIRFRPGGQPIEGLFEEPIVAAGILANGTTTGDAAFADSIDSA